MEVAQKKRLTLELRAGLRKKREGRAFSANDHFNFVFFFDAMNISIYGLLFLAS